MFIEKWISDVLDLMLRMGLIYSYEHTHRLNIKSFAFVKFAICELRILFLSLLISSIKEV
jgi:hypothetical protein